MEPTEEDFKRANKYLLEAASIIFPTSDDFIYMESLINSTRWHEEHNIEGDTAEKQVAHLLLSSMLDGIRFGNWPAAIRDLSTKK